MKKSILEYRIPLLFPFLLVFVLFNPAGLPQGLLYTTLASPLLVIFLISRNGMRGFSVFIFFYLFFFVGHLFNDSISYVDYFQTSAFVLALYVNAMFLSYLIKCDQGWKVVFERLIVINFFLCCVALAFSGSDLFWFVGTLTRGVEESARLRMFVYEPSYYATMWMPFFFFGFISFVTKRDLRSAIYFGLATTPIVLSLSFGVLGCAILAAAISSLFFLRGLLKSARFWFLFIASVLALVVVLNSDGVLATRLLNVFLGEDSSGNNRLVESPLVAWAIVEHTNILFGSGLGQAKFYAPIFFEEFWPGLDIVRLTNSVADTFAALGVFGLVARFSLILYWYWKSQVNASLYRSLLFWFIFFYQFTGSFPTSSAEAMIWVFAFSKRLDDKLFDTRGRSFFSRLKA